MKDGLLFIMTYMRRLALLLLLATSLTGIAQAQTLDLYTFHSPPYQISPNPTATEPVPYGTTVDTVRCVAGQMGWRTNIRTVPQNRAIHGLRNHLIDGYFAVHESELLNRFALPTAPVALEKWYFYSRQPIEDLTRARIAAIAGSNEAIWLAQSRYRITMTASYPKQLLALLDRGRVDAVLTDKRVMMMHWGDITAPHRLYSRFVRFAPLSLYLAQPFTNSHPNFISEFNSHISRCLEGGFELSGQERAALASQARVLMNGLVQDYDLKARLARVDPPPPLGEILELDQRWQELAPAQASERAAEILSSPLSAMLAQWQYEQGGLITEILVMDSVGRNVAISVLTSDYWQGDEAKFETLVGTTRGTLYLSRVHFDPSTREFQVITAMPVFDPATDRFLGAVAIGLDIEKVLRRQDLPPGSQADLN